MFPLVISFQGDYGMKVIMVPPGATMGEVATIASDQLVGVVVKPPPAGTTLKVHRYGEAEALPDALTIGEAGFIAMETLEILIH